MTKQFMAPVIGACMILGAVAPALAADAYRYRPLEDFGRGNTIGRGLNNLGQVVGNSDTDLGAMAFVTGPNGKGLKQIVIRDAQASDAFEINDQGQVIAQADKLDGLHIYRTEHGAKGLTDVGKLNGFKPKTYARVLGINQAGQMVGLAEPSRGQSSQAFITAADGTLIRFLGTFPGGFASFAYAVNDAGCAVGSGDKPGYVSAAFIMCPADIALRDLGHLGNPTTFALSINANGEVVGTSKDASGYERPFITGPNGEGLRDLGTPTGFTQGSASSINAAGQVVGAAYTTTSILSHAMVTGPGGIDPRDLNTLVTIPDVVLQRAVAINDLGQIVTVSSDSKTYLLTPR